MKYIIIKQLNGTGFRGMAIYPFIIMKNSKLKDNKIFINHESIHIRQQLELLFILFFILYFLEYIIRLIQYKSFRLAYLNISFEREAYRNQAKHSYLKRRKLWSFIKYL
jgi:hypothetical protein